jgi:hypothetical protein
MNMKQMSTIIQLLGALTFCAGIALYSERAAIVCGGVILTLFGIALERGSAQ